MNKIALHWQLAIAIGLAAVTAAIVDADTTLLGASLLSIFDFVGSLFINALKMVIVPLILASVIVGVYSMARRKGLALVGGSTVMLYLLTGFLAIFTGLFAVNLFAPGETEASRALLQAMPDAQTVMDKVAGRDASDLIDIIARAVPSNIFQAALETQLLALIFVGVLFGYFMSRLTGSKADTMLQFWEGVYEVMIMITMWVMRFAPIGVFALLSKTLIVSGFVVLESLIVFFFTVLFALAVHFLVWLPLLLRFVAGVRPFEYYRKVSAAQITAFSTASSSATLPVTINSATKAGVPRRVTSFVLPLGSTVNMDGTALYECVVVLFIAQIYGLDLSVTQQLFVVLLALLTSVGVAGIPAASLVAITLILTAVGLPAEAVAVVLAVDRILDMCRTAVNVTSDLSVSAMVASRVDDGDGNTQQAQQV